MVKYKEKVCLLCGAVYAPTGSTQKYCVGCKVEARRIRGRKKDKIRNRKRYNYTEYTRNCKHCGVEFKTYYKKKVYCGADECDKVRLYIKNKRIQARRPQEYMIEKGRKYYKKNRDQLLIERAVKYRKKHPDAKPYVGGRIYKWSLEAVREYVESRGYKLLSNKYTNNKHKLLLECPNGHEWETTFHNFKDGEVKCFWCYLDNNYTSKFEESVREYVNKLYSGPIIYNDRKQITNPNTGCNFELDIWFPDLNKAIECNGVYWHTRTESYERDQLKSELCYTNGIDLLIITDDNWPSETDKASISSFVGGANENLLG